MENLDNYKKNSMHGKIMLFEKTEYSWKNHGILKNDLMKPPDTCVSDS